MIFPYPIIVLDTENRQQPNTPGWAENISIGANLLKDDKVAGTFQAVGGGAGEKFTAWRESVGSPKVTSFNTPGDKMKLDAIGVEVDWERDIMAVANAQMKLAGALKLLDGGKEGRFKWPTLEEAVEFYGVPVGVSHTIAGDVDMASSIVIEMNRLSGGGR